jgi:hypothetical protein
VNGSKLRQRVVAAAEAALAGQQNTSAAIDILTGLGWLPPSTLDLTAFSLLGMEPAAPYAAPSCDGEAHALELPAGSGGPSPRHRVGSWVPVIPVVEVRLAEQLDEEDQPHHGTHQVRRRDARVSDRNQALGGHPKPASDGHLKTGQLM